ncbi:hypothetical protein T484DRAFT_1781960 [Baffinella frigidus]|nr:hypothetical protein T484DRAFT_1781960 [Cryptophyta sp. CCMP2293]
MAGAAGVAFVNLSAVHAGLAEVKKVVKDAQAARSFSGKGTVLFLMTASRSFSGKGTVLFLDEIHRFNKLQQGTVLFLDEIHRFNKLQQVLLSCLV